MIRKIIKTGNKTGGAPKSAPSSGSSGISGGAYRHSAKRANAQSDLVVQSFKRAASMVSERAKKNGLFVPGFSTPPGIAGATRSLRKDKKDNFEVLISVSGRMGSKVLEDMIEGVCAVNKEQDSAQIRDVLWGNSYKSGIVPIESGAVPAKSGASPVLPPVSSPNFPLEPLEDAEPLDESLLDNLLNSGMLKKGLIAA